MIDAYSFGRMTVNGKEYRKDLIIFPDGKILSPWWRKSGHKLTLDDLDVVLKKDITTLVIGTGKPGMMKPDTSLIADLQQKGIKATVMSSSKAMDEFNNLSSRSDNVAACFHLTC